MSFISRISAISVAAALSLPGFVQASTVVWSQDFEGFAANTRGLLMDGTETTTLNGALITAGFKDSWVWSSDLDSSGPAPQSKWVMNSKNPSCTPTQISDGTCTAVDPLELRLSNGALFDSLKIDTFIVSSDNIRVAFHDSATNSWVDINGQTGSDSVLADCASTNCYNSGTTLSYSGLADGVRFSGTQNRYFLDNISLSLSGTQPNPNPNVVPEPASLALVGLGLLGAAMRRKSKRA